MPKCTVAFPERQFEISVKILGVQFCNCVIGTCLNSQIILHSA